MIWLYHHNDRMNTMVLATAYVLLQRVGYVYYSNLEASFQTSKTHRRKLLKSCCSVVRTLVLFSRDDDVNSLDLCLVSTWLAGY